MALSGFLENNLESTDTYLWNAITRKRNKEKTLRPRSMNDGTKSLFAHRRDKDFTVVTLMAEKN